MITREKINQVVHNEKTVLLQKNARCPKCGGSLYKREGANQQWIWCLNCDIRYVPVDTGLTDNELICKVIGGEERP